jgi:hypothetical protein
LKALDEEEDLRKVIEVFETLDAKYIEFWVAFIIRYWIKFIKIILKGKIS